MRLLTVVGTRPEAIKMAPVIEALRRDDRICSAVCTTGQHRELLDAVLALFEIAPTYDLDVASRGDRDLTGITVAVLEGIRDVIADFRPDRVLVHGDTATTLATTIASGYQQIPVGHVEAGLRTGDLKAPWPEEMNRRLVAGVADLHFAPTALARDNLLREGIDPATIAVTGNTGIDALRSVSARLDDDAALVASLADRFGYLDPARRLILVTGHRRESFGTGIAQICRALARLATRDDVQIVYPVHPNPAVHDAVHAQLSPQHGVHLIGPLDYLSFVFLMRRAHLILTDSGGIQEEAPSLGKPVLVMRDATERPEALIGGRSRLVGTDPATLVAEVGRLLDAPPSSTASAPHDNPYGDGRASGRIVARLATAHGLPSPRTEASMEGTRAPHPRGAPSSPSQ